MAKHNNDPAGAHERFLNALALLPKKPADEASQKEKKRYSEMISEKVAYAIAEELRRLGLSGTRPAAPGVTDESGAERRMAGGIGAKKVDVSWASEESGLLLGVSIKSISFRDRKAKNYQKNLPNRRGDMLFESVTLHRRFPYAVLLGLFFFDEGAETDGTNNREATFANAHDRFALFTGRDDPAGREEQYELLYLVLLNADKRPPRADIFAVGAPDKPERIETVLNRAISLVAKRNPDFYQVHDGRLLRTEQASRSKRKKKQSDNPPAQQDGDAPGEPG